MAGVDEELDPLDPEAIANLDRVEADADKEQERIARGLLDRRALAYRRLFLGANPEDAKIVMDDLTRFCRGDTTSFDINERVHVLITGRQEVHRRIVDHLELTTDALLGRYNKKD